jgi:hypothetical protein
MKIILLVFLIVSNGLFSEGIIYNEDDGSITLRKIVLENFPKAQHFTNTSFHYEYDLKKGKRISTKILFRKNTEKGFSNGGEVAFEMEGKGKFTFSLVTPSLKERQIMCAIEVSSGVEDSNPGDISNHKKFQYAHKQKRNVNQTSLKNLPIEVQRKIQVKRAKHRAKSTTLFVDNL